MPRGEILLTDRVVHFQSNGSPKVRSILSKFSVVVSLNSGATEVTENAVFR
jgi:hypothetical protein